MPATTRTQEREGLPLYPSAKQLLNRWGRDHLYLHLLPDTFWVHWQVVIFSLDRQTCIMFGTFGGDYGSGCKNYTEWSLT